MTQTHLNTDDMHIEYMPLSDLMGRFYEGNPKDHDLGQIHHSYDTFGYVAPPIFDETTKLLVAGHGRLIALSQDKKAGKPAPKRIQERADGEWLVPVVRGIAFDSPVQATAYLIADNQLAIMGGWNDDMLVDVLREIADEAPDILDATGFTGDDLDALIRDLEGAPTAHSEAEVGSSPQDKLDGFLNATIKQLVFYFPTERYVEVVEVMQTLMDKHSLETHTDVFEMLLTFYEERHETVSG